MSRLPLGHSQGEGREFKLEDKIKHQLAASGELERLKKLLSDKLEACGWKDDLKQRSLEFINRKGREHVTVDDVVKAIKPEGRASVPDSVKAELLAELKKFILNIG